MTANGMCGTFQPKWVVGTDGRHDDKAWLGLDGRMGGFACTCSLHCVSTTFAGDKENQPARFFFFLRPDFRSTDNLCENPGRPDQN